MYHITVNPDGSANVHFKPFDPVHGYGKSREELEQIGFFVDEIPEPESIIGKAAILKGDMNTKTIWYEYVDRELTEYEKIVLLEQDNADLWYESFLKDQKIATAEQEIADLWYTIFMMGGN